MADPFTQLAIYTAATGALLAGGPVAVPIAITGILASYGISISSITGTGVGTATVGTTVGTTIGTTIGTTVGTAVGTGVGTGVVGTAVGTTALATTATTVGTTVGSTALATTATTTAGVALGPFLGIALAVAGVGVGAKVLYNRSKSRKQELLEICGHIALGEAEIKKYQTALESYLLQKQILSNKIALEKQKLQSHQFEEEILEGNRIFMVIGETGTGKSTFCNRLLGDKSEEGDEGFYVSHGDRGTSKLSKKTFKNNTESFTIVDTPGCNDEDGEEKDDEYMNNIIGYLNGCGGVNAFLLVISLAEARIKGSLINLWKQYQERFGKEFWKYSVLVLTNLDLVNQTKKVLRTKNCFDKLKEKFNVTNPKCIMIGHKNYEKAIKELLTKYSKNKFIKNNLKAPLHDLLKEEKELIDKISDSEKLVAGYSIEIEKLKKRKKQLL